MPHGLAELEDADRKLRTLYAFMQSISTTLDMGELLERIVRNLLDIFPTPTRWPSTCATPTTAAWSRGAWRGATPGRPRLSTLPGQFHEEVVLQGRAVLSTPHRRPAQASAPAGCRCTRR